MIDSNALSKMTVLQAIVSHLANVDESRQGYRQVIGHLRSLGMFVTQANVRRIVAELHPERSAERLLRVTRRREYYVEHVNDLWHIDGQHKLVDWKFVIHGCIDGKSRAIVFMQVNDNNRADSVCKAFLNATDKWGWPSRMRGDKGGENTLVASWVNYVRGQ